MFRDSYCSKQEAAFDGCSVIAEKSALIWQRNLRLPFHNSHQWYLVHELIGISSNEPVTMGGLSKKVTVSCAIMSYLSLIRFKSSSRNKNLSSSSICLALDINNVAFSLSFRKMVKLGHTSNETLSTPGMHWGCSKPSKFGQWESLRINCAKFYPNCFENTNIPWRSLAHKN